MAKQRLFIVDNDQKTLRVLEASLLKAGYSVTTSLDGADALDKITLSPPDLIICEVVLPQMSGYDFCRKIKDNPVTRAIPFIFLTRLRSVTDKVKGLELGVDDYLTKPIYLKEVLTRVKLLLEKKEKERLELSGSEPRFSGSLSDIGIVDLIQTLELGNKTAEVHLTKEDRKAILYFKKGKIVDAEMGRLTGESAVYKILNWSEGTFRVDFEEITRQDKIGQNNQALIMEGMRRIDEIIRTQEQLPPPNSILVIDSQSVLSEHPQQFPSRIEGLMAEFDGKSTIEDIVDRSGYDELEAYEIVARLYFQGFLVSTGEVKPQSPVIFKKAEAEGPQAADHDAFLRTPEETSVKIGSDEAEEAAVEASSFMKPPMEEDAQSDVEVLDGKKEGTGGEKDSKVIFLKPSQLADRIKPKDAKAQKKFWEDEPLVASLEKVLSTPDPGLTADRADRAAHPEVRPSPPPASAAETDRKGRSAASRPSRPVPAPGPAPAPRSSPSGMSFLWKTLAIAAPPLIVVAGLFAGRDYILSKISLRAPSAPRDVSPKEESPADRAEALIKSGKESEALALLNAELDRTPPSARGFFLRGSLRAKNPATVTQGIDDLRHALEISPQDKEAALALGSELLKNGQARQAVAALTKAADLDPRSSRAFSLLGTAYKNTGDSTAALSSYVKALELEPEDIIVRLTLGKLYVDAGSLDLAQEQLKSVLSRADPVKERDIIADARRYLGQIDAARTKSVPRPTARPPRTASLAPTKKPPARAGKDDEAQAHHMKGRALYGDGKVKEAIVEYRLALLQTPRDPGLLVDLGNALFDDGQDAEAVSALEKALTVDARDAKAHLSLGGIYSTKGDKARAIFHYRKYLDLEPKGSSAEEVRTILKNLGG